MVGRLLCFLIVGIQASGISIPLSSIEIAESTSIEIEIEIETEIEIEIAEPTSIEIAESKFQKLGYLRSESTTANQPQNGPVREQHLIVGIIMRIEMPQ